MKKVILLFFVVFLFVGCSPKNPNLKTVKSVDINRYLGTWYEIGRFEHFFERDCKNVSATYTLREDGKIEVINRCTLISTNMKKEATGVAHAIDKSNSKLKVSLFRPFYGDYWIINLDEDYKYVLVGSPSREYLWILSRTKKMDKVTKNKLLESALKHDFDIYKLIWTIQE